VSKIKVTTYFLASSQTSRMALAIGIAALPIIITALHIVYARESIASDTS
jgi:hypothetical protein